MLSIYRERFFPLANFAAKVTFETLVSERERSEQLGLLLKL